MCPWSRAIENFSKSKNLSPWPSRNWSTSLVLVRASVLIHLNKDLTKNSKIRFIAYSFGGNFLKQGQSLLKFSLSYNNHVSKPQMITITLNTFENIDKKFHNDPRKTLGDMCIYFRGGLTFVVLFILIKCSLRLQPWLPIDEFKVPSTSPARIHWGLILLDSYFYCLYPHCFLGFMSIAYKLECENDVKHPGLLVCQIAYSHKPKNIIKTQRCQKNIR